MIQELIQGEFEARHGPSIDAAAIEYFGLLLPLQRLRDDQTALIKSRFWSLGEGLACALMHKGILIFGDINETECSDIIATIAPAEIGRLRGSERLVRHAIKLFGKSGVTFSDPMPQLTMELREQPRTRSTEGMGRIASDFDIDLVTDWFASFQAEALPDQPTFPIDRLKTRCRQLIDVSQIAIWEENGKQVSMAAIVTVLPQCAAISMVYTPPELRGCGYAGAVVTQLAVKILESSRPACLYVDARNPISTRCYTNNGFECISRHADAVRV